MHKYFEKGTALQCLSNIRYYALEKKCIALTSVGVGWWGPGGDSES